LNKITFLFVTIAVILLSLCSCGQNNKTEFNNLIIENESNAEIASIGIYVDNQSHGVANANNSPIAKGEVLGFKMDEKRGCIFRVEVHDIAGSLISQGEFIKDFINQADEQVHLYIKDGDNSKVYITD
jgi:hypothetical protein